MKSQLCLLLVFALGSAAGSFVTASDKIDLDRKTPVPADQPVPVVDFFRFPAFRDPVLNRAGTHVAAIVSGARDQSDLFVFNFEKKVPEVWSAAAERDVLDLAWLDDTRLVFTVGKDRVAHDAVMADDVARVSEAYALFQQCFASLVGVPDGDRLHPLFWVSGLIDAGDRKNGGIVRVNTDLNTGPMTGFGSKIPEVVTNQMRIDNTRHVLKTFPLLAGEFTLGYLSDQHGELAFGINSSSAGKGTLHRFNDEGWTACPVDLDLIHIIEPGLQPGELVVRGPYEEGKPQPLRLLDATTGKPGTELLTDEAYDFNGWLYRHPDTHQILGVHFQRNGPRTVWFDERYKVLQKSLEGSFPGMVARIISSDIVEKNFLVSVYSDRQPAQYFRINFEEKSVGLLQTSRPWIDPARMRPISMFKFKTAEGRSLDAYVTLPAGVSKERPAPMVVLPHARVRERTTWEFDAEAQFLASRGYAVLQPNYRGSTGYDWMFPYADRWAFRKMHDDVTAATQAVLATGLIDRDRVAIMGTEFGGYLALSGAVHEPETYRCAVVISGVFDWERQMQSDKFSQYDNPTYAVLRRWLGEPAAEKSRFDEISPLRHVSKDTRPTFVFHGREDNVASVAQARALIDELKKNGVPHEAVVLGGEVHSLSYLKNRVELYSRIATFLEKNLKSGPSPKR